LAALLSLALGWRGFWVGGFDGRPRFLRMG